MLALSAKLSSPIAEVRERALRTLHSKLSCGLLRLSLAVRAQNSARVSASPPSRGRCHGRRPPAALPRGLRVIRVWHIS